MGRAIELSRVHMEAGGDGPCGAVIVKAGDINFRGLCGISETPSCGLTD